MSKTPTKTNSKSSAGNDSKTGQPGRRPGKTGEGHPNKKHSQQLAARKSKPLP